MLFLGNYVDHGDHQLHAVCLLLLLKARHPSSYFLLRGKHESKEINGDMSDDGGSFAKACEKRFGPDDGHWVWNMINTIFNHLPFEALVDRDYYCASEGLVSGMETKVQAPKDADDEGNEKVRLVRRRVVVRCDVRGHSSSRILYPVGQWKSALIYFLNKHNLSMLVQGRQQKVVAGWKQAAAVAVSVSCRDRQCRYHGHL